MERYVMAGYLSYNKTIRVYRIPKITHHIQYIMMLENYLKPLNSKDMERG